MSDGLDDVFGSFDVHGMSVEEIEAEIGELESQIEALHARVDGLRLQRDISLAQQSDQYEADYDEALERYMLEGGRVDSDGTPLDEGHFSDVFQQMQEERIENGLL